MNVIALSTREHILPPFQEVNTNELFKLKYKKSKQIKNLDTNNEVNNWFWCSHPIHIWIPAKIELKDKNDNIIIYKSIDGENLEYNLDTLKEFNRCERHTLSESIDDLINLHEFSEAAVLYKLRERFFSDQIYTNIGNLLISINPFIRLSQMNNDVILYYREDSLNNRKVPHMYNVASKALSNIFSTKKDQSIIISGESGSGKTESAKYILLYLSKVVESDLHCEDILLSSNPILEAFGNAKTIYNNNSSRFGKWMEIIFDCSFNGKAKIKGATIVSYLLEKVRVIKQGKGERNFHIFYMICRGLSEKIRKKYYLCDPDTYNYLNSNNTILESREKEIYLWKEVKESFKKLKFDEKDLISIIRIISGILNLGNITFEETSNDECKIKNKESLTIVANLLKLSPQVLEEALTVIKRKVGNEKIITILPVHKAIDNRDSIAQTIYHRLFLWIITKINDSVKYFKLEEEKCCSIGILDIFGFENFKKNYFEQFCINYANEKLQQHFTEFIFQEELKEYFNEEIEINGIDFKDSTEVLDLLERKRIGILDILDEEVRLPNGNDSSFLNNLNNIYEDKNINSCFGNKTNNEFIIKHYADSVTYSINDFVKKNKNDFSFYLGTSIASSKDELLKLLFNDFVDIDKMNRIYCLKSKITLVSQFSVSLEDLMNKIRSTNPFFVRCIKPNSSDEPYKFDSKLVLEQMKNGGLVVAIRVRAQGFEYRKGLFEFINRYKWCLNGKHLHFIQKTKLLKQKAEYIIDILYKNNKIPKKKIKIGRTKIFYNIESMKALEDARDKNIRRFVIIIQCKIRSYLDRKRFNKYKKAYYDLVSSIQSRNINKIKKTLSNSFSVDFLNHKIIVEAKSLLNDLQIEKEISKTRKSNNIVIMKEYIKKLSISNICIKDSKVKFVIKEFKRYINIAEIKSKEQEFFNEIQKAYRLNDHSRVEEYLKKIESEKIREKVSENLSEEMKALYKKDEILSHELLIGKEIKKAIKSKDLNKMQKVYSKIKNDPQYLNTSLNELRSSLILFKEKMEEANNTKKEVIIINKDLSDSCSENQENSSNLLCKLNKKGEKENYKLLDTEKNKIILEKSLNIELRFDFDQLYSIFNEQKTKNFLSDHSRIRGSNKDENKNFKTFFQFQKINIHSPLLSIPENYEGGHYIFKYFALESFKCILKYFNSDKNYIQVLKKFCRIGLKHQIMRDELFSQLVKQTTNSDRNTLLKGLKMLYIALNTFPPSLEMRSILLSHLSRLSNLNKVNWEFLDFSTIDDTCLCCIINLEKEFENFNSTLSVRELKAITNNELIKISIYTLDGSLFTFEIDSLSSNELVIKDLLKAIIIRLKKLYNVNLNKNKDFIKKFGIFIYKVKNRDSNVKKNNKLYLNLDSEKYIDNSISISKFLRIFEKYGSKEGKDSLNSTIIVFQYNKFTDSDCLYPESYYLVGLIYAQARLMLSKKTNGNKKLINNISKLAAYQFLIENGNEKSNSFTNKYEIQKLIPEFFFSMYSSDEWFKKINIELQNINGKTYKKSFSNKRYLFMRKYNEICGYLMFDRKVVNVTKEF